jgi:hypothetical protein
MLKQCAGCFYVKQPGIFPSSVKSVRISSAVQGWIFLFDLRSPSQLNSRITMRISVQNRIQQRDTQAL